MPSRRREMAKDAVVAKGISIRLACDIFQVSQTCYRYNAKRNAENEEIARWLIRPTDNQRNWGVITSSRASPSKVRMSSDSIAPCAMSGYPSTAGTISRTCSCSRRGGCTNTIMTAHILPWAASRHNSGWPWPRDSTSARPQFRWDYPCINLANKNTARK